MSALPGQHYCTAHQGNHAHYDPHNCTVCVLAKALAECLMHLGQDYYAFHPVRYNANMALNKVMLP